MAVVGGLAAVVGATAGCQPSGTALDPLLVGLVAAGATVALVRSVWWALVPSLLLGVVALPLAGSLVCLAALCTCAAGLRWPRLAAARAVVALVAVAAVLHLPSPGPFGTSALLALVTLGPGVVLGARRWAGPHLLRRLRSTRRRRQVLLVLGGVALAYLGLLVWTGWDLDRGAGEVSGAVERATRGDSTGAAADLGSARDRFARTHVLLDGWWSRPLRAVPIVSQHVRAIDAVAVEGTDLADAAVATLEIADVEDLRSHDGRFDVARMSDLPGPLAETADSIRASRAALGDVGRDWLSPPLTDRLTSLDGDLAGAADDADEAGAALRVIPGLLGADGPRHYFIAFVTPAELRGSGGFVGSFAEVTTDDGEVELVRSGSITEAESVLQEAGVKLRGPEDYVTRYARYRPARLLRDVTVSPHFPYVGAVVRNTYAQTGRQLDGVISIDPVAVAALLQLTGPIEVEGLDRPVGPDDAARFLLEDSYAELPDSAAQNRVLADLVEETFDRLTTQELPGPRRIAEALGPPTRDGRIRMWSPRRAEQRFFGRLGATGAFPRPRAGHDFLALSSQNAGNNKLDVYQSRRVAYDVELDASGGLRATVDVTITNDVPLDRDLPDFVTGNRQGDPRGTNATRLSVHTPHRLLRARVDGEDVGLDPGEEAGYRAYTFLVRVPPGEEVTLTLDLEGELAASDGYTLDLAPQPTVDGDRLRVEVEGPGGSRATWGPGPALGHRRISLPLDP